MVRALEDVENALVALAAERQRVQSLQTAAASSEAALGRAQSLYDRGQIDLLPLLDAQRARLSVRLSANDSSTQLLLDSVQLYKALGGGWQVFEPATPAGRRRPPPVRRFPENPSLQRGTVLKTYSLAAVGAIAVSRDALRMQPGTAAGAGAPARPHLRAALRQGPGNQPLRRHRAVAA